MKCKGKTSIETLSTGDLRLMGEGGEFSLEDGEVRAEHCDFQGNTK